MARSLVDITELDRQLERELSKYGNIKDFHVTLWRHEPDETGCNWNARIERIQLRGLNDTSWWDVVPLMRERLNLI